jgi:hypothetical protein
MRVMARHFLMVGGVALAVVAGAVLATPRAAKGADATGKSLAQCFREGEISNWVAPDAKTLYLKVYTNQVFKVALSRECSPLRFQGARLITHSYGPDLICSPVDWNLRASEGGPGDIPEPCFIQSITRLTPDEAAALPKNAKP